MHGRNLVLPICMVAAMSMCLCGCSSDNNDTSASGTTVELASGTSLDADSDATGSDAVEVSADTLSDVFTDRDLSTDYDASSAVQISLDKDTASSSSKDVSIEGSTVTINSEGVYIISGTLDNGMIIVDAKNEKVQLVLDNVTINNDSSAAIYVRKADKVFITTVEGTENTLTGGKEYVAIDDNNIDAAIFSKSDLTLSGLGTLNITSDSGHGIVSKNDLKVTNGTYVINSGDHGLSGKDSVSIAGGTISITCTEDGIHSENDDDSDLGNVYIAGGDISISAGDDGVHAGNLLTMVAGSVDISKSYEGLEGYIISIEGGLVNIVASDDGINAAGGSDGSGNWTGKGGGMMNGDTDISLTVSGGTIYVEAEGDGIDSNGSLTVSGGEMYIDGPTGSGNGAIDYETTGTITGGTVVAIGANGMAESFSTVENQGCIMTNVNQSTAGTYIALLSEDGTELVSWTSKKSFSNVVVSTPDIKQGETYTLKVGDNETTITMDELSYGSSSMGGMGGNGGFGGGDGKGGNGGDGKGDKGGMTKPDDNAASSTDAGEVPEMPDGGDGGFEMPDGMTMPDGGDGSFEMPDGMTMPDGGDGSFEMPDGMTMPDGAQGGNQGQSDAKGQTSM